jgi:hypothetical protein
MKFGSVLLAGVASAAPFRSSAQCSCRPCCISLHCADSHIIVNHQIARQIGTSKQHLCCRWNNWKVGRSGEVQPVTDWQFEKCNVVSCFCCVGTERRGSCAEMQIFTLKCSFCPEAVNNSWCALHCPDSQWVHCRTVCGPQP